MQKEEILNELLKILENYFNRSFKKSDNFIENRKLFRAICNINLNLDGIDKKFYDLQNQLLQIELKEKQVVDVESLKYKNNIAHFNGDITTLKADAIVNAANDQFLGCFVPCHNCIDNVIMSASGFQMRNELTELKHQKDYLKQQVKVTKGYNLPSKFVFHVAGPICYDEPTEQNKIDLQNCYIYCLNKAKEMGLKNIVFCCISTGEYHFPNKQACEIAVKEVKNWLNLNNFCLKVIFCTYKNIDKELYDNELSGKN